MVKVLGRGARKQAKGEYYYVPPEEWMEKGANETTPPDVAGAAKTKRTKGSLVCKGWFL